MWRCHWTPRIWFPVNVFIVTQGLTRLLCKIYKASKYGWPWILPFKVKSNGAVGLTYDFLLVSNSNYMSNSYRLGVIATRTFFSYLLSLVPNFGPPTPTLTPGRFFSKSNRFFLGHREGSHQKWSWLVKYFLRYLVHRHTHRHTGKHDKCKLRNPGVGRV